MSADLYCEPCRRLLRGELHVINQEEFYVEFDHHIDFRSFDTAMRLPCLICSFAYTHAKNYPSEVSWVKLLGCYQYISHDDKRTLSFFPCGGEEYFPKSATLVLKPWFNVSEHTILLELSPSTQSDSTINFLLEKYQDCRDNHTQCNVSGRQVSSGYPSRVLDVGSEEDSLIVLRSTEKFRKEEYVCLSHCWGDTRPFTLNVETQFAITSGIDAAILPKTFRDAILVTRRLGIQYLWIDSLCIQQDNNHDWATESGRMDHIYAQAACTIAATSSRDGSGGLFFNRCPRLTAPQRVQFEFDPAAEWLEEKEDGFVLSGTYLCEIDHLAGHCVENGPLNSRAWVSQERQLSRRLLHFTSKQLFWECHECMACETYPERLPDWGRPFMIRDATLLKKQLNRIMRQDTNKLSTCLTSRGPPKSLDKDIYLAWETYLDQYSRGGLTYDTDKLVAIRGIANRLSQATGDEFVAGIWKSRFVEGLCWRTDGSATGVTNWRAPTWSWASSNSPIRFSLLNRFHDSHAGRGLEAEVLEFDVGTKNSGELQHASMKILCRPLPARYTPVSALKDLGDGLCGLLKLLDQEGDALRCCRGDAVWFSPDGGDTKLAEPQHGYVVVFQKCLHERPTNSSNLGAEKGTESIQSDKKVEGEETDHLPEEDKDYLAALFLTKLNEPEETFERTGFILFRRSPAVNQVLKAHRMTEETVITVI